MPSYFFQAGSNPALSLAEIEAVLSPTSTAMAPEGFTLSCDEIREPQHLLKRLGGTIRIAKIHEEQAATPEAILASLTGEELATLIPFGETKTSFGISILGVQGGRKLIRTLHQAGIRLKRELKQRGHKPRYVANTDSPALSGASVLKNRLYESSSELLLIHDAGKTLVATTCAIQDLESYTYRDEFRPERDKKIGMLPIKVAQMMLNISRAPEGSTILDPFAGLGTILQEAMLMGYKAFGSDASFETIDRCKANLAWAKNHLAPKRQQFSVTHAEAESIDSVWKGAEIGAIVTEGFLGTPLSRNATELQAMALFQRLKPTYLGFFEPPNAFSMPEQTLVVALPAYPQKEGPVTAPWLDSIATSGYTQLNLLQDRDVPGYIQERSSFLYARPQAHVGREITVWKRTSST